VEIIENQTGKCMQVIRSNHIFRDLSHDRLQDLQRLFLISKYDRGEMICLKTSKEKISFVAKGEVAKVSYSLDSGKRFIYYFFKKGDSFKTSADMEDDHILISRSTSATVMSIDVENIPLVFEGHRDVAEALYRSSWNMQGKMLERMNLLLSKNAKQRVFSTLSFLQKELHASMCEGVYMDYTHQELADFINVERETVTKYMTLLTNEGVIEKRRRHYMIVKGGTQILHSA
jgi:CRP-like cAMP-binding protein